MIVLVVDDQRSARRHVRSILEGFHDIEVVEADNLPEARVAIEQRPIDLALIDIRLSDDTRNMDGLTLVKEVAERTAAVPICVTASHEMEIIRAAMRAGAYDYLLKETLSEDVLAPLIRALRERRKLEREVVKLRARVSMGAAAPGLIGTSVAMERLRAVVRRVALSDRPVLVVGPTGSGKELVAQAIHLLGPNPEAPLLDLNCGAIPEALVEAQLFGHERGAFTGAERRGTGYFAAAGEGTLFLDEIAELPLALQPKLLRVLETGRFRAVGTTAESVFRGRVIAATHADLEDRVRQGRFRDDLYYRLNVLSVNVPSLSARLEDIAGLVAHFVKQQHRALRFTPQAIEYLERLPWPGNVRELRNVIDRVAVFAEADEVTPTILQEMVGGADSLRDEELLQRLAKAVLRLSAPNKLDLVEAALVETALEQADGNKSGAARLLGVHRKVIERRVGRANDTDDDLPEADR